MGFWSGVRDWVGFSADLVGVLGATGVVYAIAYPETIGAYLNRISADVEVITESIPLWPLIEAAKYTFEPPRFAGIEITVANPKNVVVEDFAAFATFSIGDASYQAQLDSPPILPPNETLELSENIIRLDWFPATLKAESFSVGFCFIGTLEGQDDPFSETRLYNYVRLQQKFQLVSREFLQGAAATCG